MDGAMAWQLEGLLDVDTGEQTTCITSLSAYGGWCFIKVKSRSQRGFDVHNLDLGDKVIVPNRKKIRLRDLTDLFSLPIRILN